MLTSIAQLVATGEAWNDDVQMLAPAAVPVTWGVAPRPDEPPAPVVDLPAVAVDADPEPMDALALLDLLPADEPYLPLPSAPLPDTADLDITAPVEPAQLPVALAPEPAADRSSLEAALAELLPGSAEQPEAAPVPAAPRVQLGFRDGTSTTLDPSSSQSRALEELAQSLTRRD